MAEYVERESIMKFPMRKDRCDNECVNKYVIFGIELVLGHIKNLPAADVAPVVHGRWEWFDEETGTPIDGYEREWGWRCSCCRTELSDDYDDPDICPKMKYCSSCGAKMDGDAGHADD